MKALSELILWDDNYNHNDVTAIARSIRRFGFNGAPRIWRGDEVRGGNHSVKALRLIQEEGPRPDLDKSYPPQGVTIGESGEWYIPIIDISHLEPIEATAFAIADNQHARNATHDEQKLLDYLKDIATDPILFNATGYNEDGLEKLQALVAQMDHEQMAKQPSPDIPALAQAEWNVQSGDLWLIPSPYGEHRLICGDVTDTHTVQRLFGSGAAQGIVTSPPYAQQRVEEYDSIPTSGYVEWWKTVQNNLAGVIQHDASFFLNIKPHVEDGERVLYVFDLVLAMVREWGWCLIDEFSWSRNGVPGKWNNRFKNGFEPVYHFARSTEIKFKPEQVGATSKGTAEKTTNANTGDYYNTTGVSWEYALPSNRLDFLQTADGHGHPAAYPIELPSFFIRAYSDIGDIWLDPFAGSGTSLMAAHQFQRVGYGIERKPDYCALILQRFCEMGLTPVKHG